MEETLFRISSHALILYVDQLALSLDQHIAPPYTNMGETLFFF